jgi:hypothetical protein
VLALEILAYALIITMALVFSFGVWRLATRDADPIHFAPLPLPEKKAIAALHAAVAGDRAAFRAAVAPGPASTSPSTSLRKLRRQLTTTHEIADPVLLVVLAAATWHDRCGLVPVPLLTRALLGLGMATADAVRILVDLDAGGVLELRADVSEATLHAAHLCPRVHGALLGVARVRIGDIEGPVNDVVAALSSATVNTVSHVAGQEPHVHHVRPGDRFTGCGLDIGQLAQGLVGRSGEIGWTTRGASTTCIGCRRALGLVAGDLDQDAGATIMVGDDAPRSAPTLLSAGVGGR